MRSARHDALRTVGAALVAATLAVAPPLRAGETTSHIQWMISGTEVGEELGKRFDVLGDVDGDGAPDLVIGSPRHSRPDGLKGIAWLASGRTGKEIRGWHTPGVVNYGMAVARGGDIDKDGLEDVLVAGRGRVEEIASRSGRVLVTVLRHAWVFEGVELLSLGDIDGDGTPDFAAGNPRPEGKEFPDVRAYSGASGKMLWEHTGERLDSRLGVRMHLVDDSDADGMKDIAVSETAWPEPTPSSGRVSIMSARDGTVLRTLQDSATGGFFGASLATLSDLNSDGHTDLAVGAPSHSPPGFDDIGRVIVFSAASNVSLWIRTGETGITGSYLGDDLGTWVANAGDQNGDGFDDLATATGGEVAGWDMDYRQVLVLDGRAGTAITVVEGDRSYIRFGYHIARLGDLDGDGQPELAVGAPRYAPDNSMHGSWDYGAIYAVSASPARGAFVRGDADGDGRLTVSDAVLLVLHLLDGRPVSCEEALDVNRSTEVNVGDALIVLGHLYLGKGPPQPPYPDCAAFLTGVETLPCERSACGP